MDVKTEAEVNRIRKKGRMMDGEEVTDRCKERRTDILEREED